MSTAEERYRVLQIIHLFGSLQDSGIGRADTPANRNTAITQIIVPQLPLFLIHLADNGKQTYRAMLAIFLGKLITPQVGSTFPRR